MYRMNVLPQDDWKNSPMMMPGMEDMLKSLEAGTGVDAASFTGGRAMTYESLDSMLQSVTLAADDHAFWRMLPKRAIHATVDQYNRRTSYAGSRWGFAAAESANPAEHMAEIARAYATVKFYRDLRSVSDVSMMVNMTQDPLVEEQQAATLAILETLSPDLYWGDSAALPYRVDGMYKHLKGNCPVVDAKGDTLSSRVDFEELAALVRNAGGRLTHTLMNPLLQADMSTMYESAERITMLQREQVGSKDPMWYAGSALGGVITAQGVIAFEGDPFNRVGWQAPVSGEGPNPPSAITSVTGAAAGTGGTTPTGAYFYKVCAVAEGTLINGQSAPVASVAVNVTLGQKVTLTITRADATATGFFVYRSAIDAADETDCRYIGAVATGGATTSFVDDGSVVPGTANMLLLDMRQNSTARPVQWSQLLPMTMKKLAETGPTRPFLMSLIGTLRVSAPEWCAMVTNILPDKVKKGYGTIPAWNPLGVA